MPDCMHAHLIQGMSREGVDGFVVDGELIQC